VVQGKVGLYDSGGSLVASATKTVSSTSAAWVGATSGTETSPQNVVLTGGATYYIAITESVYTVTLYQGSTADTMQWNNHTYTDGLPATLPSPTSGTGPFSLRFGVDQAGGGASNTDRTTLVGAATLTGVAGYLGSGIVPTIGAATLTGIAGYLGTGIRPSGVIRGAS
jgi:hypothetical protein